MKGIQIAIINASTVLKDREVADVVPALQTQVSRDLQAVWGIDAELQNIPRGEKSPAHAWQLVILDNSDQAGALGYHDLTKSGLPLGKVFAGTDLKYGLNWTVTASHELLEMIVDPNINLVAFDQEGSSLYAYEVCDACEADRFAYKIGDVLVSDFVYPGWFEPLHATRGESFDFRKKIKKPFELLPGGYIGVFEITGGSGWKQVTADRALSYKARPAVGSRRERRRTPIRQWQRSTR